MEPFASKYRPSNLEEYIGQKQLVGESGSLQTFIQKNKVPSMILWGPPGTGKTTLAYIISKQVNANFYKLSAVNSGKNELKKIVVQALKDFKLSTENQLFQDSKQTILFLDEIHRWNKAQQDALLPYIEKGVITLIGATTENPSFALIPALLSRTRVFVLNKHSEVEVLDYLKMIISKHNSIEDKQINIEEELLKKIANSSDGDLRTAANILEAAWNLSENGKIDKELLISVSSNFLQYEKTGEDHYNLISAVHKSMRDSDPDASVYWVNRMLVSGDDPLYIARRLLRFASEDIGNADPQSVILANAVFETCQKLGRPECDVALSQLAMYLANAPKDNSAYVADTLAKEDVNKFGSLPVPLHLRNAPTKLMKELNYGKGYKYAHDFPEAKVDQEHFPEELKGRKYTKNKNSKS